MTSMSTSAPIVRTALGSTALGWELGEAIEEALHSRRREQHQDSRRGFADVLKAVRRATGNEHE